METLLVVPDFISFTLGMLVYFIGGSMIRRHAVLREFNIPEPDPGREGHEHANVARAGMPVTVNASR